MCVCESLDEMCTESVGISGEFYEEGFVETWDDKFEWLSSKSVKGNNGIRNKTNY